MYDNVETWDTISSYWPNAANRGQALITARNHSLAFEIGDGSLEVEHWDNQTGSQFLLHLLSGHISAEILTSQSKSAFDLSERLSGHALALSNMAGLIHRRSWTIQEMVEVYDRQPMFKDGLEAIWQLSFQNLSPNSASLLSILVFCNPDSIPETLFHPGLDHNMPDSLAWCPDEEKSVYKTLQISSTIELT